VKNIIVFAVNDYCSVVLDCLEKEAKYNVVGIVDLKPNKDSTFFD